MTSWTSRDGCVLSACAIFINNAGLWKTIKVSLLFYLTEWLFTVNCH